MGSEAREHGALARPPGSPTEHLGWGGAVREGSLIVAALPLGVRKVSDPP